MLYSFIIFSTTIKSRDDEEKTNIAGFETEVESEVGVIEEDTGVVGDGYGETVEKPTEIPSEETIYIPATSVNLDAFLQDYIFTLCDEKRISPYIILAMIERESDCDPSVIGDNGNSYGLMQIQPKWHYELMESLGVTTEELLDPYCNVLVGISLVEQIADEYDAEVGYVLMCYNGGPAYAEKMANKGKLSDYAIEVMERASELSEEVEDRYYGNN